MAKKTYDLLFKLLLIGDSGVGKSSILWRFSDDSFNRNFIAKTGIDFKLKTIELKGKKIKLQIWNTAGQERLGTITSADCRGAKGIILVYDITNEKSFDQVATWLRKIEEYAPKNVEKMILGNKCDMENQRAVPKELGEELARQLDVPFLETSARTGVNIEKAFYDMADLILLKTSPHEDSLTDPVVLKPNPPGSDVKRKTCW